MKKLFLFCTLIIAFNSFVWTQSQSTTGNIEGHVVDPNRRETVHMTEPYREPHVPSVAPELIDELLITAVDFAHRRQCGSSVSAACAVIAGLTLLLRQATPAEVAEWLKCLAAEIEATGQSPPLRELPHRRLQLLQPPSSSP